MSAPTPQALRVLQNALDQHIHDYAAKPGPRDHFLEAAQTEARQWLDSYWLSMKDNA